MNNLMYIMAANLIVWLGLFAIIMRVDRKLSKVEKKCQKEL